jgi:hypothetical protein
MANVLNLVKNKKLKIAYPKSSADFEILKKIGLSVKFCKLDFLPLLRVAALNKKVSICIEDFEVLETRALASLQKKWPGGFELSKKGLILRCPRDDIHLALMKSVRLSLTKFYQGHGLKLDYVIKRGAKTVSVTFTHTPLTSVFVLNDER